MNRIPHRVSKELRTLAVNYNSQSVPTAQSYKVGSFSQNEYHLLPPQMFVQFICFGAEYSNWVVMSSNAAHFPHSCSTTNRLERSL